MYEDLIAQDAEVAYMPPVTDEPSRSTTEPPSSSEFEYVCDRCGCGCDDTNNVRIGHRGSGDWCESCTEEHTRECDDCGATYSYSDGDGEHCDRCADNYSTCDHCENLVLNDNLHSVHVGDSTREYWCGDCCDSDAHSPDDEDDEADYWADSYYPSSDEPESAGFRKMDYHSHSMRRSVMCHGKDTPHVGFEFEVRGDFDEQAKLLANAGFTEYDLMPEHDGSLDNGDTEWVSRPVPREEAVEWAMKFVEAVSHDDEFANNGCGCHFNIYCSEYGVRDKEEFAGRLALAISTNRVALELFSNDRDLGCYAADSVTPRHHGAVQKSGDRVEIRLCAMTETPEWMGLQVRTYLEIIDRVIAYPQLSNLNMFKYLTPNLRELWESTMVDNNELWEGTTWVDPAQLMLEFKEPVDPLADSTGLAYKAGDNVVITDPGQVYSTYTELAERMRLRHIWARGRESESLGDLVSARIVCDVVASAWHSMEEKREVLAVQDPRDDKVFLISARGVQRVAEEHIPAATTPTHHQIMADLDALQQRVLGGDPVQLRVASNESPFMIRGRSAGLRSGLMQQSIEAQINPAPIYHWVTELHPVASEVIPQPIVQPSDIAFEYSSGATTGRVNVPFRQGESLRDTLARICEVTRVPMTHWTRLIPLPFGPYIRFIGDRRSYNFGKAELIFKITPSHIGPLVTMSADTGEILSNLNLEAFKAESIICA